MSAAGAEAWQGPIYLETSALVKLFVPEAESDALNEALLGAEDVIVSDLALTEMASALGRRTRERSLTAAEARQIHRRAQRLAASCRRADIVPTVHRRAVALLLTSRSIPLRTLDALHLALALETASATKRHIRSPPSLRSRAPWDLRRS